MIDMQAIYNGIESCASNCRDLSLGPRDTALALRELAAEIDEIVEQNKKEKDLRQ